MFNALVNRYGRRTVCSLGEMDRGTYALGLSKVIEVTETQAIVEQEKLDQFNKYLGLE